MVAELKKLRQDEIDVVMKAPAYVSILIAGADGNIDKVEKKEAISIANLKQNRSRDQLNEYYNHINLKEQFDVLVEELPSGVEDRNRAIIRELRKLNFILKKVDRTFAIKLYASLKDLAKKIAEASGGVLSYLSVSYEEAKLIELKMLKDPATF